MILPFHWDHPHICIDKKNKIKWKGTLMLNNIDFNARQSCCGWFDVRLTLSDTIFFVLMRLMISSWIQDEMEYPLMRTISSPTYKSIQNGIVLNDTFIFNMSSQVKEDIASPVIYLSIWWIYQTLFDLYDLFKYSCFNHVCGVKMTYSQV